MTETAVYIDSLRLHAYHGVLPQERVVGNDYVVSLSVAYPWAKAGESDTLADTLSYAELANVVEREMSTASQLLEHVAWRIAEAIHREWPEATAVTIDIKKVAPPMRWDTNGCGVTLTKHFLAM